MQGLSKRLKTIASLVPNGARVCDIGTDHGYLSIYLKQNNIAKTVIASDLNRKPLLTAKKNIDKAGVIGIELRFGNGLSIVKENEVDTVIIAGMGGEVISGIIDDCKWIKNSKYTLILQPTTSAEFLRRFLTQNGFETVSEIPLSENGKIYSIMQVNFTNNTKNYPEHYYYIGNISPKSDEGLLYIQKQQKILSSCINSLENIPSKQEEFKKYKTAYLGITKILTENQNGI